jgi:large subunit ribosomal protein L15
VKLHDLRPPKGSRRPTRRLGRGTGAGQGKTAGRGTKGQLARTGPGLPAWFEGGQTPLHMRVPKLRGFTNRFRRDYVAVNVGVLAQYAVDGKVSPESLAAKGLIGAERKVKILGEGSPEGALEVRAHAISATARRKVEAAGGSVVLIEGD